MVVQSERPNLTEFQTMYEKRGSTEGEDQKSGRQLKIMMEYSQLEENWPAKEIFSNSGEMVSG